MQPSEIVDIDATQCSYAAQYWLERLGATSGVVCATARDSVLVNVGSPDWPRLIWAWRVACKVREAAQC